ncbi:MAG: hypothetical protein EXS51_01050 [Candidatus Taylorbacteria bacterium]|nr:hypothetical protein [Candidatus Taylorbacteria bacterium]
MEPTQSNASGKIITALIIGLLVGFATGVFWQARRTGDVVKNISTSKEEAAVGEVIKEKEGVVAPTEKKEASETPATGAVTTKGLSVTDQPAGGRVEIASIDAKDILWVAVREVKGGVLGNILGAQKVFVGNAQKTTIELLRPTVAGSTYKVVVYKDVGAAAFNYREDVIVAGEEATFKAN